MSVRFHSGGLGCYIGNVSVSFFFKPTLNLQPAIQGFMNSLTKKGQSYWVIQAH